MGGANSKTISERVLLSSSKNVSEMITSCSSEATASQLVQIANVKGDVSIDNLSFRQKQILNVDCLLTNENVRTMIDSVRETMISEVNNDSVMSGIANSNATVQNGLYSSTTDETVDTVKSSIAAVVTNTQELNVANIGGNVTLGDISFEQRTDMVTQALLDASGLSSVLKEMEREESSTSKNKESTVIGETLQGISNVVSSMFMVWIVLGIGLVVFLMYKTGML
uniref:Lipid membrane protein of large eukaryotic DNA virus n=1 Tax=Carcinus maenas virus 1 TaxID=2704945 RepID=A0A6G9HDJ0_9VIRU|nr:lipid membrane protein of large eukaryotic DNA virus [Carcinus maenas virus 1]